MRTPTIEEIAENIGKPRLGEHAPTHPADNILFHGEKYSPAELKDHVLKKSNIGRLYTAEQIGHELELEHENDAQ